MYSTADFRTGLKIELDGKPFTIIEFLHVKPGKGGAFVRTKLKNMLSGQVLEKTFRSGEKIAQPNIQEKEMQSKFLSGDYLEACRCYIINERIKTEEANIGFVFCWISTDSKITGIKVIRITDFTVTKPSNCSYWRTVFKGCYQIQGGC